MSVFRAASVREPLWEPWVELRQSDRDEVLAVGRTIRECYRGAELPLFAPEEVSQLFLAMFKRPPISTDA